MSSSSIWLDIVIKRKRKNGFRTGDILLFYSQQKYYRNRNYTFSRLCFKKGKMYLPYAMKHTGEIDVQLLSFLTLALDGGRWSNSRTGRFHPLPPIWDRTPVVIE